MNIEEIAFWDLSNIYDKYVERGSSSVTMFDNLMLARYGPVEAYPGAGHNVYAILKASYKIYSVDPKSNINQILYSRLVHLLENEKLSKEDIIYIMQFIYFQSENELTGLANYKWDLKHLIGILVNCLKNKNVEDMSFDKEMEQWVSEREQTISSLSK